MILGDRLHLMGEQPPKRITEAALNRAGVEDASVASAFAAPVAHLAFGATTGVLFGLLRPLAASLPGGPLGVAFGLGIYAISYMGWIPALKILPPPDRDRPGRPAVMVLAHIVYGAVLGQVT